MEFSLEKALKQVFSFYDSSNSIVVIRPKWIVSIQKFDGNFCDYIDREFETYEEVIKYCKELV